MFQIIRYAANYCPIYGGMTGGSTAHRLPMTYRNRVLAEKLAARLHRAEYDYGGDDSYGVKGVNESAYPQYNSAPVGGWKDSWDDIPF